jgi:hypothetical protein
MRLADITTSDPTQFEPEVTMTDMSPNYDNPLDTITMDMPLFIRMLEWAKEDSETDMDLHRAAENAVNLHAAILTMKDYDSIIVRSFGVDKGPTIQHFELK